MNKCHDFTEDAHIRLEQKGEGAFIVLLPCCILHPCCNNVYEFMGLPMMEHKIEGGEYGNSWWISFVSTRGS